MAHRQSGKLTKALAPLQVDGFSDEQLLTIMGLFEMYGCLISQTGAKAFHVGPCFTKSSCRPNSYQVSML